MSTHERQSDGRKGRVATGMGASLLALALASSCGGAATMHHEASPGPPVVTGERDQDLKAAARARAQIEALMTEDGAPPARTGPSGREVETGGGGPPDPLAQPDGEVMRGGVVHARGDCGQVCEASQAICASSDVVCEIAGAYPTEADLRGDCDWALQACTGAKERCQVCR